MPDVIDLKPYITFIRGEYKFMFLDKFLEEHPELNRIMPYLEQRQEEEMEKLYERSIKNEKCK